MSVGETTTLPVMPLGPMIRAAVRDKSYQRCPVGVEVQRYLSDLRWEGATKNTLETYEQVLAWLAQDHDDFELETFASPVGTEYLKEFLKRHWEDSAPATKANRSSIVRSFFKWAVDEGKLGYNPAVGIKGSRRRHHERTAYSRGLIVKLVSAQDSLRDQCALQLLARMGLRKNELRVLRIRDIDLARNLLVVHGKGARVEVLPIGFKGLAQDLYLHIAAEGREPDEYLLYPHNLRRQPMEASTVHRWFKRCLERAELPSSIEMHELRHTAADDLWRTTGNLVLAQQLLRHASVGTTEIYLHPSKDDLEAGMRAVEDSWKESKA